MSPPLAVQPWGGEAASAQADSGGLHRTPRGALHPCSGRPLVSSAVEVLFSYYYCYFTNDSGSLCTNIAQGPSPRASQGRWLGAGEVSGLARGQGPCLGLLHRSPEFGLGSRVGGWRWELQGVGEKPCPVSTFSSSHGANPHCDGASRWPAPASRAPPSALCLRPSLRPAAP